VFTGLYAIVLIPSDFRRSRAKERKKTKFALSTVFSERKKEGYVAINISKIRPKWSLHRYICIYTYKHGGLYNGAFYLVTQVDTNIYLGIQ